MPIIKSAKKRVRVARKATIRNVKTKRHLRASLKSLQASFDDGKSGAKATDAFNQAQSALDKAGKKGLMHKNKVARKKRQLAAQAKAAGVKVGGASSTTKKTTTAAKPAAKPATKPAAAKKPAAKKAPAKKPTSK